ncbi:hypothetical protein C499_05118 [Halogeometricum borinquense DSM 11551]|uniref:Uncharacterized protein n=1 Tax=Halogeometricum borinquense (strain ATCC 700274 / DSM 11551 / JCM 10706 / KCTC 4070 / PR3) TaxID=469382 RepID=L9UZW7_HALBP|nr:hypothetical protein [Halogeometricum borinquense]ELY29658.1 hypothetical protein C499_05118 [Halogeometricum borinquense DSM 11551]
MNREGTAGSVLIGLSLVGYGVGVITPYPGRSASLVGLMVGVTLLAIGTSGDGA